ncbi:putative ATPase [Stackebrandtia albiflava]|uniref:Putative ATPase n=1 Tax=Stackebrandtia albiflava TaxID=406432 RepID=A0A562V2W6_9ACTN|nr:BTAD domain-containing putative transcriptional regulator [Stackebrandtia albiflava]TWJ12224.1 putative ATPase [Stackebrandtia albiflava]
MTTGVGLLVLGPVRVTVGGRAHLPRPTQADLLAALLLHRGGPVSAVELSTMVWGEYRRSALHPAVSRLRGWLREVTAGAATVVNTVNEYRIATHGHTDTRRFDDHAAAAATGTDARRLTAWTAALELFRGVPAEGARDAVREHSTTREWSLRRATAVTEATRLALRLDRADTLLDAVGKASAQHPDSEYVQASWALLLAATGRRPEALDHLERFRNRLSERFGTDPASDYFHTAQRRILRQRPAGVPAATERSRPHEWWGDRIPSPDCVGRDADLDELDTLLTRHRMVTLVGPGGIGKSTLAGRLAERQRGRRGIVGVALQAADGAEDVTAALAAACGVAGEPLRERVTAALADTDRLLLLDDCDRNGEAVADLVGRLRYAAPALGILATSRSPLGVPGEQVWRVAPLRTPDPGDLLGETGSAVELFHRVARRFDHRFRPDRTEREAIARLCRMVDGMPLAIEILASRMHIYSAHELLENLSSYGAALDLPHPAIDPRHRSMATTLDWCVDRVPEAARRLLATVSILSAPFTTDLAAAVAGEPVHHAAALLAQLTDHSLLRPVRDGGRTRFLALEPIRQHARRMLDDDAARAATHRLVAHWLRFARRLDAIPRYADRIAYAARYRHDAPHLTQAVQAGDGTGHPHAGAEILARGYEYWMCGYDLPGRGPALLEAQLAGEVPDRELHCLLRYRAGLQAALRHDYTAAQHILESTVDELAAHRPREHRQALLILATCANSRLDTDAMERAQAAIRVIGDDVSDGAPFVAACCGMATAIAWGRHDLATALADRHDTLAAAAGHRPSNTYLALRTELAVAAGDTDAAARHSAALLRRLGQPGSVGDAEPVYCAVTRTHLARGGAAAAARTARRGIAYLEGRWSQATSRTLTLRVLYAEALRRTGDTAGALAQLRYVLDHADGFTRVAVTAVPAVAAVTGDTTLAGEWERFRSTRGLPVPPALVDALTGLRPEPRAAGETSPETLVARAREALRHR